MDRQWFIASDAQRRDYLRLLGRAISRSDWKCLAYALMSSHIHLALIAGYNSLASWIRRVHSPFAVLMNRWYDRIGTVFVRGPKTLPVARAAVGIVIPYIHNNPVRAKVVARARDSSWTSHRAYLGLEEPPPWLHVREGLVLGGFADGGELDRRASDPAHAELDLDTDVLELLGDGAPTTGIVDDLVDPAEIVAATAEELGISQAQLRSRRRTALERLGRDAVVHCAERLGLRGTDVAHALGITQQAVSWIRCRGLGVEARTIGARVLQRLDIQDAGWACSAGDPAGPT